MVDRLSYTLYPTNTSAQSPPLFLILTVSLPPFADVVTFFTTPRQIVKIYMQTVAVINCETFKYVIKYHESIIDVFKSLIYLLKSCAKLNCLNCNRFKVESIKSAGRYGNKNFNW